MNRNRKDELITLKERCAKLFSEQNRFDAILTEQIMFTGRPQNERQAEVFQIKVKRETAYMRLENVLNKINAFKRHSVESAGYDIEELKAKKLALFEEINQLPDLGYTYAEWEAAPESQKKKRVGRPIVSLEQKIIRARTGVEDLMNQIALLQGNANMDDVYAMANSESITKRTGRPPFDALGKLDYDLKVIRSKIDFIVSGKSDAEVQEKLKTAMYSSSGKRLGRAFVDPAIKLAALQKKERKILKMISAMETVLTGTEVLNRKLKLKKDTRNELRRLIKNGIDAHSNQIRLDNLLGEIRDIEASISAMNGNTRSTKQVDYVKPDLSIVAVAPIATTTVYEPQGTPQATASTAEDEMKAMKETHIENRSGTSAQAVARYTESAVETRNVVNRLIQNK